MNTALTILRAALRERLSYGLGPLRRPAAEALYVAASILRRSGQDAGVKLLLRTHSKGFSAAVDERIVNTLQQATARERAGERTGLWDFYARFVDASVAASRGVASANPSRLVGSRILVVKRSRPNERGVLIVDYSYVFPLVAGLFDLRSIAAKYFIVLEPSWSGGASPEILLFSRMSVPVFVQTIEPKDQDLFARLGPPLHVAPVAANHWVDYRPTAPRPREDRDIDVIMIAAWSEGKRHWRFFDALGRLRRRGRRLKTVLVGYPIDWTREEITRQAEHFGVADQVTLFERVPQATVSELLSRSKVHVLWSRRECANRAIIEAMFADVPVIVREGLTYGYRYPYINPQTGRFVAEADLAQAMVHIIDNPGPFSPRKWALEHLTCHRSSEIVSDVVRRQAMRLGEDWTENIVPKLSALNSQVYWNPADRDRFAEDYAFLHSAILPARP